MSDAGEVVEKLPKTDKWPSVAIPSFAVQALRGVLDDPLWPNSPYLFPDPLSGKAWKPDVFSSALYYRVGALKLPELSVQGLGHSFATVMLRARVGIKTVSEALGHSTIILTADTYSHVLDSMRHEAAGEVDDVMSEILAKRV